MTKQEIKNQILKNIRRRIKRLGTHNVSLRFIGYDGKFESSGSLIFSWRRHRRSRMFKSCYSRGEFRLYYPINPLYRTYTTEKLSIPYKELKDMLHTIKKEIETLEEEGRGYGDYIS